MVAFHFDAAAVGKNAGGQFVVAVVMILFRPSQYVGYFGITVAVGKTPFFAQTGPVADHPPAGIVAVVFVIRCQSGRVGVFGHDVVTVAETTYFAAVPPDDPYQVAADTVFVTHQRLAGTRCAAEEIRQPFRQQVHRHQPHLR